MSASLRLNFVVIEYVEVVLIIVSAVAAVAGRHRPGLSGVALGLLIGAAYVLAFDIVAERRGAVYLSALNAPGPRDTFVDHS